MLRKLIAAVLILSFAAVLPASLHPQTNQSSAAQPSQAPLTLDETVQLIKQNKKDANQIAAKIAEHGVSFDLDEKTEKKLSKAGAGDQLLAEIWKVTPKGKASMQAILTSPTGVDIRASAAEALALQEIQNAGGPERSLQLASEFEKKYPESPLLTYVYTAQAKAHQDKGELDQAVEAGRKSLKLDPDNTFSLIIVALVLPQPQQLKGSPAEVREKLQEADTDANRALGLLEKLKPRPEETDGQFQQRKGALAGDAHFALGICATQKDDYEGAINQYQAAISSTNQPTFQYYYRLAEAYASIGQTPKAIEVLQKASNLARGTPMQKYADDFMTELRQR